jgi:hypothetical protein
VRQSSKKAFVLNILCIVDIDFLLSERVEIDIGDAGTGFCVADGNAADADVDDSNSADAAVDDSNAASTGDGFNCDSCNCFRADDAASVRIDSGDRFRVDDGTVADCNPADDRNPSCDRNTVDNRDCCTADASDDGRTGFSWVLEFDSGSNSLFSNFGRAGFSNRSDRVNSDDGACSSADDSDESDRDAGCVNFSADDRLDFTSPNPSI